VLRIGVLPPLQLASTVVFPCLLSAVLITYVCEGTRSARVLIFELVSLALFFPIVQAAVGLQIPPPPAGAPDPLLRPMATPDLRIQLASAAALACDLFGIVIVYQLLENRAPRVLRAIRITATIAAALILDTLVYATLAFAGKASFAEELFGQILIRPFVALIAGPLLALYLGHEKGAGAPARGALDIVLARMGALEASLRQAEEREKIFRRFFELAPDGMLVLGPAGRVVEANAAASSLTGIAPEALLGASFPELLKSWAGERAKTALEDCRSKGRASLEVALRHKNESDPRTILVRFAHVGEGSEGARRCLVALIDDTERRALEASLRHAQKMNALGTLASGIAHDFNNMLLAILGSASLLERSLDPATREGKLARLVASAAGRARELTKSLLTFSRRTPFESRPLDLNALVEETVELFCRSIEKRIEVRVHKAEHLPLVEGDAAQLQQALLNVLINAADAIAGSGTIEISTATTDVSEAEAARTPDLAKGRYATIEVADTGAGMAPEVLARIFEPFFTTKGAGKGTGLGLSTTYGIVRSHGGAIGVTSAPGAGTKIRLYFPLAQEGREADFRPPALPASPVPALGERRVVLVADDEESVRDVMSRMVEDMGFSCVAAKGGIEAVEAVRAHAGEIALCVLDLDLPELGGVEIARQVAIAAPGTPIIVVSGYGAARARRLAELPNAFFLQKPYRFEEFAAAVREALGSKAPARAGA
jgi:PAS domain S-box-containing protein